MKQVSALICCLALLCACRSETRSVRCADSSSRGWNFYFADSAAVSVFTIKTFSRGSGFADQISSTVTGLSFKNGVNYGADTVPYVNSFAAQNPKTVVGGYLDFSVDYEINFPQIGRRYQISDLEVVESVVEVNDGNSCLNGFSCYVNDVPTQVQPVGIHIANVPVVLSLSE